MAILEFQFILIQKKLFLQLWRQQKILIIENNKIILLSREHNPEIPEEKARIEKNGGEIYKVVPNENEPYRLFKKDSDFPGLVLSRSIGDSLTHRICVRDIPEINEFNNKEVEPLATVLASDEILELYNKYLTNNEVKDNINNFIEAKDANKYAKKIVKLASERSDDF